MNIPKTLQQYQGKAPATAVQAMSNWMRIHAYLHQLKPTRQTLETIGGMLCAEYQRRGGPRIHIVERLYGKFNQLRVELERASLWGN